MRKTSSMYGHFLKEALLLEQVWEKSEQLPNYLPFYVGDDLLSQLHTNSCQLVMGRRGTGKTHLLGAFTEWLWNETKDEMAVMVSIMELGQTPLIAQTESPEFAAKRTARDKFEQFLRKFFARLLDATCKHLEEREKPILREKDWKRRKDSIDSILLRLMEAVELGREYTVSKKRTKKDLRKILKAGQMGASASAGVEGLSPSLKASVSVGKEGQTTGESVIDTTIDSILSVDMVEVRELVVKLVEALGLKVLHILVDEWMEIDKNTPSSIQASFAQLLKATFFNNAHLSVKIASVWHDTTLYSKGDMSKTVGIQMGQDIQMGPDLDTAFLADEPQVLEFCKCLLFKRLVHICPELEPLAIKDKVDDVFIEEIFDTKQNFRVFVAASHGIPRDMMKIFHKCSLRMKRDFVESCIDYPLVCAVAKDSYKMEKRKSIDPGSTAQMMMNAIDEYWEEHRRRLFLVENFQAKSAPHLRELVDDEVIHQIPSAMTPRCIRNKYKAYHIDYGNIADWIETKKRDIATILEQSLIPSFPDNIETVISQYTIDAIAVCAEHITCSHCGFGFMKENPVYKKAGICPRCAEAT